MPVNQAGILIIFEEVETFDHNNMLQLTKYDNKVFKSNLLL